MQRFLIVIFLGTFVVRGADGELDLTFGPSGTGFVVSDEISGTFNEIYSAALTSDGKIVVAGRSNDGGINNFIVARYTNDSVSGTTSEVTQALNGKYRHLSV